MLRFVSFGLYCCLTVGRVDLVWLVGDLVRGFAGRLLGRAVVMTF